MKKNELIKFFVWIVEKKKKINIVNYPETLLIEDANQKQQSEKK